MVGGIGCVGLQVGGVGGWWRCVATGFQLVFLYVFLDGG